MTTNRWMASKHCGGWRVGMQDVQGRVCVLSDGASLWFHCGMNHTAVVQPGSSWIGERIPDLDHPGTRAFLLEDVRRSWGRAVSVVMPCDGRPEFAVEIEHADEWPRYWDRYTGPTEASALIAALEAAP